ncbi:hypothetical protein Ancab_017837 [Ancistrocladus abbreviatus]
MHSSVQEATATAVTNSDQSMKLAVAMALLRSKLFRNPPPHSSSTPLSDSHRWKRKAKERKQEILRLKQDIKELEDGLHGDICPQSASCKCYFFSDLGKLSPTQLTDSSDHALNDVLRRRFLRHLRFMERRKRRTNNLMERLAFSGCEQCGLKPIAVQVLFVFKFNSEDEMEQLRFSVDFLVDLCDKHFPVGSSFANLVHQAVDFILGSLKNLSSMGKNNNAIEAIVNGLIMRLVRRMCVPPLDELQDSESDRPLYIQHLIRKLGRISYVGQRVILAVSQNISELAENLLFLDPIQLIEFLVSDCLFTWSEDDYFDNRLFKDWVQSVLHARRALEIMESRAGLYVIYMDRVIGELTRQVGKASSLQKQNPDVLDSLFP